MSTVSPSHKAFVVESRDPAEDSQQGGFWTQVGTAWPHKNGKGLNLQLKPGIAVTGRIVLLPWEEEQQRSKDRAPASTV